MRLRAFVGLGLLALLCACAGNLTSGDLHSTSLSLALPATAKVTTKYLYVEYLSPAHVLRYPIVNGVLSTIPDNNLNLWVPAGGRVGGIALDAQGRLFVTVSFGEGGTTAGEIAVYSSGASGSATPLRAIEIAQPPYSAYRAYTPYGVTVDASGNIYVAMVQDTTYGYDIQTGVVDIFAPGSNGTTEPIQTLAPNRGAIAVALDSTGRLFVGGKGGELSRGLRVISEYARPLTSQQPSGEICDNYVNTGLAVGTIANAEWLFSSEHEIARHVGRLAVWKGIRTRPCPGEASQTLRIAGLDNPEPPHDNAGFSSIALDGADRKLFVASRGGRNGIYEIDAINFAPQKPIATITTKAIPVSLAVSR
jgi:hypothetical protein